MKYLKTYEGLFSFLKRKPPNPFTEYGSIHDDMFQTVSDIIQDVDMMGLRSDTVITDGKNKIYSSIDRGEVRNNTNRIDNIVNIIGGDRVQRYYDELRDYDLDEMCYILVRLVDYVRSESENQLNVNIDFIDNGPHSHGFRLTNPSEHQIRTQLSAFDGNLSKDWRTLQISIMAPRRGGTADSGPR